MCKHRYSSTASTTAVIRTVKAWAYPLPILVPQVQQQIHPTCDYSYHASYLVLVLLYIQTVGLEPSVFDGYDIKKTPPSICSAGIPLMIDIAEGAL